MTDPRKGVYAIAPAPRRLPRSSSEDISLSEAARTANRLVEQRIKYLNNWAEANLRDARRDRFRFWILKAPAFLCAAATSVLESYNLSNVVVILGAVAALCVLVDGAWPGGNLHNVHLRAFGEIRVLSNRVATAWDKVESTYPPLDDETRNERLHKLLDDVEKEIGRISGYVASAEATLGANSSSATPPKLP